MQAGDVTLKSVFSDNHRYVIPMFQRPYVWAAEREWAPMWEDIRTAADGVITDTEAGDWPDEPPRYFLGSVVLKSIRGNPQQLNGSFLIDGQQRLTTLQILIAAARAVAIEKGSEAAAARFRAWLLNDPATVHEKFPEDRHKLWPLPQDRAEYLWAVRDPEDGRLCPDTEHQVCRARVWFQKAIAVWAEEGNDPGDRLTALHSALHDRMQIAKIELEKTDNAQVIFEALNHRGVELSQSDLIKNLLFRLVEDQGSPRDAEKLLVDHWLPLDSRAWREPVTTGRITRNWLDVALAYWLTIQTQSVVSVEHLFDEFKAWLLDGNRKAADVIKQVRVHADLFDTLMTKPPTREVASLVDQVVASKTNTVWPLLLGLFSTEQAVPDEQRAVAVMAIGSYLQRRGVCGLTTKDYNNIFVSVLKAAMTADASHAGDATRDALSSLRGESRGWPSDEEFYQACCSARFYSLPKPRTRVFLAGIENYLRDDRAEESNPILAVGETLNIEHILPQKWRTNWLLPPSSNAIQAETARDAAVNMLGNLTLTNGRLNSSMSNAAWPAKRVALAGKSTLLITTSTVLAPPDASALLNWDGVWDEGAILRRTFWFADLGPIVWPRPPVDTGDTTVDDDGYPSDDDEIE